MVRLVKPAGVARTVARPASQSCITRHVRTRAGHLPLKIRSAWIRVHTEVWRRATASTVSRPCLVAVVLARAGWTPQQLTQLDREAPKPSASNVSGIQLARSRHRLLRRIDRSHWMLDEVQRQQDRTAAGSPGPVSWARYCKTMPTAGSGPVTDTSSRGTSNRTRPARLTRADTCPTGLFAPVPWSSTTAT